MKKADVVVGQTYVVKVSGLFAPVKIESISPYGGWIGRNLRSGREIRIRSAQRLRRVAASYAPNAGRGGDPALCVTNGHASNGFDRCLRCGEKL